MLLLNRSIILYDCVCRLTMIATNCCCLVNVRQKSHFIATIWTSNYFIENLLIPSSTFTFYLFSSVAELNNHDRFGYQSIKTMFCYGMSRTKIKSLVHETVFDPTKYTIEKDGTHVAEKSFPFDVGAFVYYDKADNPCTLLLRVVKVVFSVNNDGDVVVITAYPTNVSIKFRYCQTEYRILNQWLITFKKMIVLTRLFTFVWTFSTTFT